MVQSRFCIESYQGRSWSVRVSGLFFLTAKTLRCFALLAILCALAVKSQIAIAQNLIPNASFEEYTECPEGLKPFPLKQWNSPTRGNPDYYHQCANEADKGFAVPENNYGKQEAKKGNAYVGITVHSDFPTIVEYIQVDLKKKLVMDEIYHFSVHVSLAENSEISLGALAVKFSDQKYLSKKWERLKRSSTMINLSSPQLSKDDEWVQLQGFYKAKGNETSLILGNFSSHKSKNKKETGYKGRGDALSYYYIDQISLTKVFHSQCKIETENTDSLTQARSLYRKFLASIDDGALDIMDIYFPTGSAEHYPLCAADLEEVVKLLKEFPAMAVSISGHCDQLNEQNNKVLSQERAEKIADYFRMQGIEENRIEARGYSSNHPAAKGQYPWGHQQNRRAELHIKKRN